MVAVAIETRVINNTNFKWFVGWFIAYWIWRYLQLTGELFAFVHQWASMAIMTDMKLIEIMLWLCRNINSNPE